jgi:hypothetical protein
MTLYFYDVIFADGQTETVKKALGHYLNVCRREIKNGGGAPFIAHGMAIPRLLASLRKHPHGLTQIHDGEFLTLRAALSSYLEACEQGIANGEAAPFISDRSTIKMVFGLLGEVIERHSRQRDDAGGRAEEH